jgi:hypothetical protein
MQQANKGRRGQREIDLDPNCTVVTSWQGPFLDLTEPIRDQCQSSHDPGSIVSPSDAFEHHVKDIRAFSDDLVQRRHISIETVQTLGFRKPQVEMKQGRRLHSDTEFKGGMVLSICT